MNHIRARIPNYIDIGGPPPEADFETLQELLEVDFVKWKAAMPTFLRFTISSDPERHGLAVQHLLMAEMTDGKFWVVGYLKEAVDLPVWDIEVCEARLSEENRLEKEKRNRPWNHVKPPELTPLTEATITEDQKRLQQLAGIWAAL